MKAKEWVKLLVELHQNNKPDEYIDQVFRLHKECLDIVRARVGNTGVIDALNPTPLINALREGAVKWEAVRHGVASKLGQEAVLFPLIEGGIVLTIIMDMTKHEESAIRTSIRLNLVKKIVKDLNYDSIKWINERLMQMCKVVADASADAIVNAVKEKSFGDGSIQSALENIEALDASGKLEAYYRIGASLSA